MQQWMRVPADWRRRGHAEAYAIAWCRACDFGSLVPRPDSADIAEFYRVDAYYTHAHQAVGSHPSDKKFLNKLRVRLAWQFEHGVLIDRAWLRRRFFDSPARFCDIGCGAGGLLDIIKKAGYEAIGVDPDPAARQWAADLGLTVVEGTAESLPDVIQRDRFDAVFMLHTLEHCLNIDLALRNALSLLKPDGLLVVETPNLSAAACRVYGPCWLHIDAPRHINFFTAHSLQKASTMAGGIVQDVEYSGYTRQFLGDILRQQEEIWQCFSHSRDRSESGRHGLHKPTSGRAWSLLVRTLLATDARKYDSVRIIATRA